MTTYTDMLSQIEALKKEAERKRREEIAAVIKAIRQNVKDYGLTASDLGLDTSPKSGARASQKTSKTIKSKNRLKRQSKPRAPVPVKFKDDQGNSWTGRGKQPKWLQLAIASGKSLESFRI